MFLSLENPLALPASLLEPVIAIGNFDGLHRGHAAVIDRAVAMGQRLGRPTALLSFEPHPRVYFRPDLALFPLTDRNAKARLAERQGLEGLITLTFDAGLAAKTAEAFVDEILVRRLAISGAVVGFDFHFGANRAGTPQFLAEAGQRFGFMVEIVPEQQAGGVEISSTLIREKLEAGEIKAANALLGHEWFVVGTVLHGQKIGRSIGYPTANLRLADECRLRHGIYAVRLTVEGETLPGVASFGRRPTFDNGAPLLEVFVFDFSGDLYDKIVEVTFVDFIREELKFDSVEALVEQMDRDSAAARRVLA